MDLDEARRRLEATKAALDQQDQSTEADRAPVELDQTSIGRLSRMNDMQMQAMSMAGQQRRALERRRIEAALARIEAGDYGDCARCGEEIPLKRLELDPATPTCVACQSR